MVICEKLGIITCYGPLLFIKSFIRLQYGIQHRQSEEKSFKYKRSDKFKFVPTVAPPWTDPCVDGQPIGID